MCSAVATARRRRRRLFFSLAMIEDLFSEQMDAVVMMQMVSAYLDRLSQYYRQTILINLEDGIPFKQI